MNFEFHHPVETYGLSVFVFIPKDKVGNRILYYDNKENKKLRFYLNEEQKEYHKKHNTNWIIVQNHLIILDGSENIQMARERVSIRVLPWKGECPDNIKREDFARENIGSEYKRGMFGEISLPKEYYEE